VSDPERAALTYIFLASSPEVEGVTGKYWEHCKEKETSPLAHDKNLQQKTIEFTEQVIRGTR
jgi:hypothetical protein